MQQNRLAWFLSQNWQESKDDLSFGYSVQDPRRLQQAPIKVNVRCAYVYSQKEISSNNCLQPLCQLLELFVNKRQFQGKQLYDCRAWQLYCLLNCQWQQKWFLHTLCSVGGTFVLPHPTPSGTKTEFGCENGVRKWQVQFLTQLTHEEYSGRLKSIASVHSGTKVYRCLFLLAVVRFEPATIQVHNPRLECA